MKKQYQAVTAAEVIKSGDHVHTITVAHPHFQEQLDEAAFKRFGLHFHYLWNSIV